MSDTLTVETGFTLPAKSFLGKIVDGDYGLAKTYWLYGVLPGSIANLLSYAISQDSLFFVFFSAYTAYDVLVLVGTWRAANTYRGPRIWAIMAKAAVLLSSMMLAIGLLAIIVILAQAYVS